MHQLNIDNTGSSSGSDTETISDTRFRKLTYNDVLKSFNNYNISCKYSSELDIIVSYLNSQKRLYKYNCTIVNKRRVMILVPLICISSAVTVSAPFIVDFEWSGPVISITNGIVVLLICVLSFLKLETTAYTFDNMSDRYNRLYMSLETINSRLMFIENDVEQTELISNKLHEFEDKISDIKMTSVELPGYNKVLFPVLVDINIFTFIKRVETYKNNLIVRYKDVKNEIRFIKHNGGENQHDKKTRLRFLIDTKEKIKEEVIQHKNIYEDVNAVFVREIKRAEEARWFWTRLPDCDLNSIVYKHL
jgi:hypothetical protein